VRQGSLIKVPIRKMETAFGGKLPNYPLKAPIVKFRNLLKALMEFWE